MCVADVAFCGANRRVCAFLGNDKIHSMAYQFILIVMMESNRGLMRTLDKCQYDAENSHVRIDWRRHFGHEQYLGF